MTDKQAQEILSFLMPKYIDIFEIYNEPTKDDMDSEQVHPLDGDYFLSKDTRFSCVQDVKDFTLSVLTSEIAEKYYFLSYLNDGPTAFQKPLFIDCDGKLYRRMSGGKGRSTTYLPETSRIVERGEDWVKIEMNTLCYGREDDEVYSPILLKTEAGWRINSTL